MNNKSVCIVLNSNLDEGNERHNKQYQNFEGNGQRLCATYTETRYCRRRRHLFHHGQEHLRHRSCFRHSQGGLSVFTIQFD